MSCCPAKSTSSSQRSRFNTDLRLAAIQPFAFQPATHCVMPLTTYCESVMTLTIDFLLRARSPWIAAVSSIRLLVVSACDPVRTRSASPHRNMQHHPPGPGLPFPDPSPVTSTLFIITSPSSLFPIRRFLHTH